MSAPRIWAPRFEVERRADGSILMAQTGALPGHARAIPDSLVRWAAGRPDQIWLTERAGEGWRELRYAEALAQVRALATALLGLGLGPDRPLLILSENSIDHALLALAAQYGGVPYAPLSTAYSLVSTDHGKLRDIAALLRPGLVFAADGAAYGAALAAIAAPGRQVVVGTNPGPGALSLARLAATPAAPAAEAAFAGLTGDSVGKYLFTSGSTGSPKAVINSQRMMCAVDSVPVLPKPAPMI
jgi:feruloyl-CoA synthase